MLLESTLLSKIKKFVAEEAKKEQIATLVNTYKGLSFEKKADGNYPAELINQIREDLQNEKIPGYTKRADNNILDSSGQIVDLSNPETMAKIIDQIQEYVQNAALVKVYS